MARRAILLFGTALLLTLAATSMALDNGLGHFPIMGWNAWCTWGPCMRDVCNDAEVRSVADAIVSSGLAKLGYTWVMLDDCWAATTRDKDGYLQPDPKEFPYGMGSLVNYVHSKGLKFGLYTCAGNQTCRGGRPGSLGHYDQDAALFATWNVDFVKMDWCAATGLDPKVQYSQFSDSLNKTGRAIFFEMCEWGVDAPWLWAGPIANSWRISADHHDDWKTTSYIIEKAAGKSAYGKPGGWNYLDFLMTGGQGCSTNFNEHCPGMTNNEYLTEFSLWALVNSPLIVATDIRILTPIMKQILFNTEVIAINQDPLLIPGDRLGFAVCSNDIPNACQIWGKKLADGGYAVLLYNAGNNAHSITAQFAQWGWTASTKANVRDLWARKNMPAMTGSITASVPSHGVAFYKLTKTTA